MSEKRFYVKKITRDERPKLFSSVGANYKYFLVERVQRSWGDGGDFLFNFSTDKHLADRICELLNSLNDENEELLQFKKKVKKELQSRYDLSNHKPVFKAMAKELGLELV